MQETTTTTAAHLVAPDPAAWLATHLAARYAEHEHGDSAEPSVVTLEDLRGGALALAHERFRREGTPPAAGATYLAGWFAGGIASVVGFGLAAGDCGFLADSASVRWDLHPGGWPMRVHMSPHAAVAPGHPWAGLDGVEVGDPDGAAVAALVTACAPVIDACRALAPVGRVGLWNEVGDALGNALAFQFLVPATDERVARLRAAVHRPGVPWKARPRLAFATSSVLGRVHVAQKGGCCLAYTSPEADAADPYCSTCSFRAASDCDALQVAWHEQVRSTQCDRAT